MKLIFKYLTCVLLSVILLESCEDNRTENMANDKIYLINSGLQQANIYNFGTYDYDLSIYKSGYGTDEASLEFITDPSLLKTYNETQGTNYQLLPANCYSVVSNAVNISAKQVSDKYKITFNTTEIQKIQASGNQYLLPLRVKALNGIELKDSKADVLLVPNVIEPYVLFTNSGLTPSPLSISVNDPDEFEVSTKIQTNYKNNWDLKFTIEVDPQALADYSEAQNTSYAQLPANAFLLHPEAFSLATGESSKAISIRLIKKNLINAQGVNMFGEYILPLRIKTVSKYGVDPINGVQLFHISYLPDLLSRTGWEVIGWNSCISEESWYNWLNRTPDKLLDGDVSTFWGSKWDAPKALPYYFIIDMKTVKKVYRVGFTKPNDEWRGNMKKGYFEISNDQTTWTKLTDWELENNDPRTHIFDVAASKGRYLRMVITEAFYYADSSVGAASGAQMDMAEINVWGLDEK